MITWYGKKLCDSGFVINLSERKDRWERTMSELSLNGFDGLERFEAIKKEEGKYFKYGCTQSHIEIAKLQIQNGWEYVLYLEDDIIVDFFYDYSVDNSRIDKEKVCDLIISELYEKKPDVLWLGVRPEENTEKISNIFVRPKSTLMSHSYIGSLKYAHFLVDNLRYEVQNHFSGGYPIDFFISQINLKNDWRIDVYDTEGVMKNNNLVIYMTSPMIFNQGQSHSDLLDKHVYYETWVRGCYNAYVNTTNLNIKPILYE